MKTKSGPLRTVLYQVPDRLRLLVPVVLPQQWSSICSQLQQGLEKDDVAKTFEEASSPSMVSGDLFKYLERLANQEYDTLETFSW